MKKFMAEFKKFALKGNMIDLAVGVIIGGAFNALVSSLVNDIIMPALSIFTGKMDFANWFLALDGNTYETIEAAKEAGVATINYGNFISGIISFIIMAFVVFMMVRAINKLKKDEPAAPAAPTTKKCPFCKTDIPLEATKCPHCTSTLEE
jgi:large conductance mechanosensitive channel